MTDETDPPETREEELARIRKSNLQPAPAWKPGQSGNPAGKPKGTLNRATILKKYLGVTFKDKDGKTKEQPFGIDGDALTVEEAINLALIKNALKGDNVAIDQVLNTAYGKLTDKRQQLGKDDQPVDPEIRVRIIDAGHRDD